MDAIMYENKEELINYVRDAKKEGHSEHQIVSNLMVAGWDPIHIENAVMHAKIKEHEESIVFHAITGITLMTLVFLLAYMV